MSKTGPNSVILRKTVEIQTVAPLGGGGSGREQVNSMVGIMAEKYNVPANSLGELKKIVAGYASSSASMSLGDASKATGMHTTKISGNARFLVDLGFLTGGASKQATDTARKYSRAVEYKQEEVAQKLLAEAVKKQEFLSGLVSTVRIRDGMCVDEFTKHVLYVADQKNTQQNRTGARAIADLLVEAGMLNENDGKLTVAVTPPADEKENEALSPPDVKPPKVDPSQPEGKIVYKEVRNKQPNVTINITLQIPEVDDPDVYDRFFKAMKDNLFPDD